ncbi:hypothetical protein S40293_10493 [Stachybotrys chartarum IBT 40293]|nr:hypothetical protein S40293_10493 [Stachybotrys chartarum IBT 40293]
MYPASTVAVVVRNLQRHRCMTVGAGLGRADNKGAVQPDLGSPINPRPSDGFDFTDWTSQTRRPLQPVRAPAGAARGRSRCDAGGTRLDWARLQPGWHFLQVVSGDKDFWQRPSAKSNPCRAAAAPPPPGRATTTTTTIEPTPTRFRPPVASTIRRNSNG